MKRNQFSGISTFIFIIIGICIILMFCFLRGLIQPKNGFSQQIIEAEILSPENNFIGGYIYE